MSKEHAAPEPRVDPANAGDLAEVEYHPRGRSAPRGPREVLDVASSLKQGLEVPPETVRRLLAWHGVTRRGSQVNARIRESLAASRLQTIPHFESAFIDAPLRFGLVEAGHSSDLVCENVTPYGATGNDANRASPEPTDPAFLVSRLAAANKPVLGVRPDQPLAEALAVMMERDFSQVPVMATPREIKGVLSWRSIGARLALGRKPGAVREFTDEASLVSENGSLFDAIGVVKRNEYALVQGRDRTITGILTGADLSEQLQMLAEPFLLLSEIENFLRRMIEPRFSTSELVSARDPGGRSRAVASVYDLTFGEYIRLLEVPENWTKLGLHIDRATFVVSLSEIRVIRNMVMHFDPDGIGPEEQLRLREFSAFLKRLATIGVI